jgi:hypothetical protein
MPINKIERFSPLYERLNNLIIPYCNAFGIVNYTSRPLHDLDNKNILYHELKYPTFYKVLSLNKWKYCLAFITAKIIEDNSKSVISYCLLFKIDIDDKPDILPEAVKLIPQLDLSKFGHFCEKTCFEPDCRCSEILTQELCDIDIQINKNYNPQYKVLELRYQKSNHHATEHSKPKKANCLSYFKVDTITHGDGQQYNHGSFNFNNGSIKIKVLDDDICVDSISFKIVNNTYILSE